MARGKGQQKTNTEPQEAGNQPATSNAEKKPPPKAKTKKNKSTPSDMKLLPEVFRIRIHKEIQDFLHNNTEEFLTFPADLTRVERMYIHTYIRPLGLLSRSHGKGENRNLSIYKKVKKSDEASGKEELKRLTLSDKTRKKLVEKLAIDPVIPSVHSPHNGHKQTELLPRFHKNRNIQSSRYIPPKPRSIPAPLLRDKMDLPIYQYRDEILSTLDRHSVIIVSAETGSGKTTQVPQYILEECFERRLPCRTICTQPRRVAAVSVAERVAEERGEQLGQAVGYQIQFESVVSQYSNLIYTTGGCVNRSLTLNGLESVLNSMTHLVIDEVHERDRSTDFLLISVKKQLQNSNSSLKVILMSATMDINSLQKYFNNCPVINIPGKEYDIKIFYLDEILMHSGYKTRVMEAHYRKVLEEVEERKEIEKKKNKADDQQLDKHTQQMIDAAIDDCSRDEYYGDGSGHLENSLAQLFYLVVGEGISVNARHSTNGRTLLIAASMCGHSEYVLRFLELGADKTLRDEQNKAAVDYAKGECLHFLRGETVNVETNKAVIEEAELKQSLLEAYQRAFNDDEKLNHDLLLSMIEGICRNDYPGAILVFLPGFSDIIQQRDLIEETFGSDYEYRIFILHSQMDTRDQKSVLRPCAERKIILSTNIGQTSITIPDLAFVIDTGKVKVQSYDSITGSSQLSAVWISKAAANQRSGRAGRTQNGVCYRLYSKAKYDSMTDFCIPELLRIPLTEVCLHAKILDRSQSVQAYLSQALNPPSAVSVINAVKKLKILDVFDANENVTDLGRQLANIPVDVQLGKMLLYSIFFKCLDPILTIVAYHSVKDPFNMASERDQNSVAMAKRKQFAKNFPCDHMLILNMFRMYTKLASRKQHELLRTFCAQNYISEGSMQTLKSLRSKIYQQIERMYDLGPHSNVNSNDWGMIQACITAGLYPNVVKVDKRNVKYTSSIENKLGIKFASVLYRGGRGFKLIEDKEELMGMAYDWVMFHEKIRQYVNGVINYNTLVPTIMIAIMCAHKNRREPEDEDELIDDEDVEDIGEDVEIFEVDDWIKFEVNKADAELIEALRERLTMLFEYFLTSGYKDSRNSQILRFVELLRDVFWVENGRISLT